MTCQKNLVVFLVLLFGSLSYSSSLQASDLGNLKGIKWKQELPPRGGVFHDMVYGRLARPKDLLGNYVKWDRIATHLKRKGVEAVAFRIDTVSRYIDENGNGSWDEMANYHNQVRLMTGKLEKKGIKVVLFSRIWLDRNSNDDVFDRFNTYLKTLTKNQRNKIDGIALTEIHLSDMDVIKRRCKWIPTKFHQKYPGWLRQRIFIMPGMENGFRFKGVLVDDDFHKRMNDLVGEFAFSVKAMKLKDHAAYDSFPNHVSRAGKSVDEREDYFGTKMGLDELVIYQESALFTHPNMANIVFWGDSGDAMTNMNPKAAQALHNVLNQFLGEKSKSAFQYAAVGGDSLADDPDNPNDIERTNAKSVIWYDQYTDTFTRHHLEFGKWEGVMGVYFQWYRWFADDPYYH